MSKRIIILTNSQWQLLNELIMIGSKAIKIEHWGTTKIKRYFKTIKKFENLEKIPEVKIKLIKQELSK